MKFYENFQSKFRKGMKSLEEKYSRSRGKGNVKTETEVFNHPRKDNQVRSGKK